MLPRTSRGHREVSSRWESTPWWFDPHMKICAWQETQLVKICTNRWHHMSNINSFDPWTVWLHTLDKHVFWCCLVQTPGNLPGPVSCLWLIQKLPSLANSDFRLCLVEALQPCLCEWHGQAVVWLLCFLRVPVRNINMSHYLYKRSFKIYVWQLCSSVILYSILKKIISAWLVVSWVRSTGLIYI